MPAVAFENRTAGPESTARNWYPWRGNPILKDLRDRKVWVPAKRHRACVATTTRNVAVELVAKRARYQYRRELRAVIDGGTWTSDWPRDHQLPFGGGERGRLYRIGASIRAQTSSNAAWDGMAWRRLSERAVAYALRERAANGFVHSTTEALLDWIEGELDAVNPVWERDATPLEAWGRLQVNIAPWDVHLVDEAASLFDQAMRVGDCEEAARVVTAVSAQIRRQYDDCLPDDCSTAARSRHAAPDELGEGFIFSAVAVGRRRAPSRRGSREPATAERFLLDRCPGYTIAQLRECLRRGKPSANSRAIRTVLLPAIREVACAKLATHKALAGALQCGVRAIDRAAAS